MVNGNLLFESANDLWKTDGTPAGTVLVKEFSIIGLAGDSSSVVANNVLFFSADGDDGNGHELWKSNGTAAGTVVVKNINPDSSSSYPIHFTAMGGVAYFAAREPTYGWELWKSNGTSAGTVMVKNIHTLDCATYACDSSPQHLTTVGTRVFFSALTPTVGREPWVTDGTTAGTTLLKDIKASGGSDPSLFIANGTTLFFSADDGTTGRELWKSDGTTGGTTLVKDIYPGATWDGSMLSTPEHALAVMGGELYFQARDALDNDELWKSDGTSGGTLKVKDINLTGTVGSDSGYFSVVGDTLYFSATDGTTGRELWSSQGTEATTIRVTDINSGPAGSITMPIMAGTARVFFGATDGSHGSEPWVLHNETVDPIDPGTVAGSSHTPGTWSNDDQVTVQWSGASDIGSSGVRGYSVTLDTSPSTTPDQVVDVLHVTDPHQWTSPSLPDGTNYWFHLSTCDWAGNCTSTKHRGPFWIESQPPTGTSTLASTSHSVNVWSADTTVAMQWSGATDGGSGMQGYSVLFDSNASTDPDAILEVTHDADPHTWDETLGEGTYWFHLRACDVAGNCSAAQHSGPYIIDGTAPSNPSSMSSTSHTISEWSSTASVSMAWSGADDASGSGVAGYSVLIDTSSNTEIDSSTEVAHDGGSPPQTWTSPDLSNGNSYWFHLRSCDATGICAETVHTGPFMIDISPPTDPSLASSSSHTSGTWSNDPEVDISWSGATGAPWGSAVDGYKVKFNTSPTVWDPGTEHWVDHDGSTNYSGTLAEGENHYFHLKTCDEAGNCTSTVHLGPFKIDLSAPSAPSATASTSHESGVWSADTEITIEWSGAGDTGGSGLAGYSASCDDSPTGIPDLLTDVAHSSDPHTFTSQSLADGSNWYCHIRSCDVAGSCADPVHLGPFSIESTAPTNPTVSSTSHVASEWSNTDQIQMNWQNASDDSSGLAGYSFEFSTSPGTVPDTTLDQVHNSDPHSTSSAVLPDGTSHWFHLRTCDTAENCSATVHRGPYWIDTREPTDPTVSSSPQTTGVWSKYSTVNISWSGATDGAGESGVHGYSYHFDTTADTLPDTEIDSYQINHTTSLPGEALDDGDSHFFHLRTTDRAGNWTSTRHLGPLMIDTLAPDVAAANVHSTSHTVGVESLDPTIDMAWTTAFDAGSGLIGYHRSFSAFPTTTCGALNLAPSTTGVSSLSLDNGSWYFHLCATDELGNQSDAFTTGPYVINAAADLSIAVADSPDFVQPGEGLTYTVTILNNGPSAASHYSLSFSLPIDVTALSTNPGSPSCQMYDEHPWRVVCDWQGDDLGSGASRQISVVTRVEEWAAGPLVAQASLTPWDPQDPKASNNSVQITTGFPNFDDTDMAVLVTGDPDPISPGGTITYTVTVSNEGPAWGDGVYLFHPLPPDTTFSSSVPIPPDCTIYDIGGGELQVGCELGNMGPSEKKVTTLTLDVDPTYDDEWLHSFFFVESDQEDPVPNNNEDDVLTAVGAGFDATDMAVSATGDPDPISPGGTITYTVTVTNEGPASGNGVYLFHPLPPGTTFSSSVPGPPDCTVSDIGGGEFQVGCELGNMGPSETKVTTLTLGVDPDYDDEWLHSFFYVESDQEDSDPLNNEDDVLTAVGPEPEAPPPCLVRPFDDTNEGSFGASFMDAPREYCSQLFVPLTDGPYDCRWGGAFYVTDIGTRWSSTGPVAPTTAGFLVRTPHDSDGPGPAAGNLFLSDVPSPASFPDGDDVFNGRYESEASNREALGSSTGYVVWACHQTVGALTRNLVTTADFSAGTTATPCKTKVNSGSFVDCTDSQPMLRAIAISARFAGIAGVGDGGQVVPPSASVSAAVFRAFLHSDADLLRVEIEHDVANPTAIHLHSAAAGETGPIIFDFPDLESPIQVDDIPLSPQNLLDLAEGKLYVDIHSAAHSDGEVRGQLVPAKAEITDHLFTDGFE